jgi:hypothetical protein
MDNLQKVLKVFKDAGKPLRPGDVAQQAGVDKKEAAQIIKDLKKQGKLISPKQCFYSLPE